MKVCLVIIYNHQYNQNIEKINKIYCGKFSRIVHLMPFYDGEPDEDIITVYESSYCFQGYFAQGSKFFMNDEFDYYLFLADDCILNPNINEKTLCDYFRLKQGGGYIKSLEPLTYKKGIISFPKFDLCLSSEGIGKLSEFEGNDHFIYIRRAKGKLENTREFLIENYIPAKNKLKEIYAKHGVMVDDFAPPLLLSFSDLVICPKASISSFCKLCGAFAAANLHAEIATPTALAIACEKITTERELNNVGKFGEQNHNNTRIKKIQDISKLFKKNVLFIHPIKLSKCRM